MSKSKWELKKLEGNEEFRKKNYSASIGLYTEAIGKINYKIINKIIIQYYLNNNYIELDPTQDTLYNNRGLAYMNIGDNIKAKKDLNKAIDINPRNVKALRRLSTVLLTEGELFESQLYLERAYKIDPKAEFIEENLKEVKDLSVKKDNLSTYKTLKDYDKCYEILQLLVSKCEKCFEFKKDYIEMCINTFNIENGLNFYKNHFNDNEKKNDYIQYLLSLMFFTDGKYEQSRIILCNLLSSTHDDKIIEDSKNLTSKLEQILDLKTKANECFKNNNFNGAIEVYDKLLNLDNNNKLFNALILSNKALCYYKKGELFDALHEINESIKLNNKYWKSYLRRAKINISLKYGDQAKSDLKKVLDLDPSNNETLTLLDEVMREEQKTKRKDLYKILELDKYCTQDDIRNSYKKLVHKWHPDKNNANKEQKEYAEKKFKDINEAYTILSNPNKKDIYDSGGYPGEDTNDHNNNDESNNFIYEKYKNSGNVNKNSKNINNCSSYNNKYKSNNKNSYDSRNTGFSNNNASNESLNRQYTNHNYDKKKRDRSRDYHY